MFSLFIVKSIQLVIVIIFHLFSASRRISLSTHAHRITCVSGWLGVWHVIY